MLGCDDIGGVLFKERERRKRNTKSNNNNVKFVTYVCVAKINAKYKQIYLFNCFPFLFLFDSLIHSFTCANGKCPPHHTFCLSSCVSWIFYFIFISTFFFLTYVQTTHFIFNPLVLLHTRSVYNLDFVH